MKIYKQLGDVIGWERRLAKAVEALNDEQD